MKVMVINRRAVRTVLIGVLLILAVYTMSIFQISLGYRQTQMSFEWFQVNKMHIHDNGQTEAQREIDMFRYMMHADVTCPQFIRAGSIDDGGWNVCIAEPFTLKQPCIVYSFGVSDDWSFDDYMATQFGCTVKSFDPSINLQDHQRGALQWFYNAGLGGFNGKKAGTDWQFYTFGTFLTQFGEEGDTIDYLKFDVGGDEIPSLNAMFEENSLQRVKQLAFEFHFGGNFSVEYEAILEIMLRLTDLGFMKWSFHENGRCGVHSLLKPELQTTVCVEVVYLNSRFLDSNFRPSPLEVEQVDIKRNLQRNVAAPGHHDHYSRNFVFLKLPPLPVSSPETAPSILQRLMTEREITCPQHARLAKEQENLGADGDGWNVCLAKPLGFPRPCLGYTFVVEKTNADARRYWKFDDELHGLFQCEMHSFAFEAASHIYNRGNLLFIHVGGLRGSRQDESVNQLSLADILQQTGNQDTAIDVVKVDARPNTWQVLQYLVQDDGLDMVKQLVIELSSCRTAAFKAQIHILQQLKKRGFYKWASFPCSNKENDNVYRVSYVNARFVRRY